MTPDSHGEGNGSWLSLARARFEGTKIAEEWEVFDELGMLQQIGAIPE